MAATVGARTVLSTEAPAKINLYLRITGRRADGYHLLDSLVAFTETGDRLTAELSDRLRLDIAGPFSDALPSDGGNNLVLRAASALQAAAGISTGARITLEKNLPVASGIGGGSADAAAALRLLARLWRIEGGEALSAEIAPALGADVPVCLASVPAVFSGIGDVVSPVPAFPDCGVVLLNAGEGVETPAVFKARRDGFSTKVPWVPPNSPAEFFAGLSGQGNDLTDSAMSVSPVVRDVLAALAESDGCRLARLSGSGGTCFGLFEDSSTASDVASEIASNHPRWWCVPTRFRAAAPQITSRNRMQDR